VTNNPTIRTMLNVVVQKVTKPFQRKKNLEAGKEGEQA